MDVRIVVPAGTNISIIENEYPDIYVDEEDFDGYDTYFVGKSMEEYKEGGGEEGEDDQWMTHDEAVECCGFVEGAIEEAETLIEGNGDWAQGMLSRKDFSGFACSDEAIAEYKRVSDLWWKAHKKGNEMRSKLDEQVDQFFRDTNPPPGFVIRLYPNDKWTVKYETTGLSREKAARIVEAIKRALVKDPSAEPIDAAKDHFVDVAEMVDK